MAQVLETSASTVLSPAWKEKMCLSIPPAADSKLALGTITGNSRLMLHLSGRKLTGTRVAPGVLGVGPKEKTLGSIHSSDPTHPGAAAGEFQGSDLMEGDGGFRSAQSWHCLKSFFLQVWVLTPQDKWLGVWPFPWPLLVLLSWNSGPVRSVFLLSNTVVYLHVCKS